MAAGQPQGVAPTTQPEGCGYLSFYITILFLTIFFPINSYSVTQSTFSGSYEFQLIDINNAVDLRSDFKDNQSYADMRLQLKAAFQINENTAGVAAFEVGYIPFGIGSDNASEAGALPGTDSINLKLKNVYMDFTLPNAASNFIVGLQPFKIFDGLLADEEAFGIKYLINADRKVEINYINIYNNNLRESGYANEPNPERNSNFISAFYENNAYGNDIFSLLVGYYTDASAIVTTDSIYDTTRMYDKRKALYIGFGYDWDIYGADMTFDWIYEKGSKRYTDDVTGESVSKKTSGYLVDIIAKKELNKNFDLNFEVLLATGDDDKTNKKDKEFMPIDGLNNFYNRAYILTGYITKDDASRKTDIFDSPVYNLANVMFFKLDGTYKVSDTKKIDLAVMYAMNDAKVKTLATNEETDIGTEVDLTASFDIYKAEGKQSGLVLNIFGAYFIPGKVYEFYDERQADDVYLFGTDLKYTF